MLRQCQISTSRDSGIRKIRGGLGRFSGTLRRMIRITPISSSRGRGITASGILPRVTRSGSFPSAATKLRASSAKILKRHFFGYYLHGKGEKPTWQASTFQSGSNTWKTYAAWPPKEAKPTKLYLHADGTLSFTAPEKCETDKALSRICFRSSQPGSLSRTADLANLSRGRLAYLGSSRPAFRGSPAGRVELCERATRPRLGDHRPAGGRAVCLHIRYRFRFCREIDRCLSAGCAEDRAGSRTMARARPVRAIAKRI